jgi:hypothetical protein
VCVFVSVRSLGLVLDLEKKKKKKKKKTLIGLPCHRMFASLAILVFLAHLNTVVAAPCIPGTGGGGGGSFTNADCDSTAGASQGFNADSGEYLWSDADHRGLCQVRSEGGEVFVGATGIA